MYVETPAYPAFDGEMRLKFNKANLRIERHPISAFIILYLGLGDAT